MEGEGKPRDGKTRGIYKTLETGGRAIEEKKEEPSYKVTSVEMK